MVRAGNTINGLVSTRLSTAGPGHTAEPVCVSEPHSGLRCGAVRGRQAAKSFNVRLSSWMTTAAVGRFISPTAAMYFTTVLVITTGVSGGAKPA
ncbi:hypothetical protein ADL03_15550 [Nocardia sp. NRRL S-836]|nr:hypothetical protein ADL03_15550 [Nocardia sp. NRRL S-836]